MRSVAVALLLAVSATPAAAGRSPYGWLDDVEVLPERGVELEGWVEEQDGWRAFGDEVDVTRAGWSATVGLTDRVELELPVEWRWQERAGSELERWGGEVRVRLAAPDPLEAPPVVALLRLRAARFVAERGVYRIEPGAVVSAELGRVRLTFDAALAVDVAEDDAALRVRAGAGVSVGLVGDLRGGVEGFAELGDPDAVARWVAVGPSAAYTHGRMWLTAAALVGVHRVAAAPRLAWGIAF